MKALQRKRLFFLGQKKATNGSSFLSVEKKDFTSELEMDSWKLLLEIAVNFIIFSYFSILKNILNLK